MTAEIIIAVRGELPQNLKKTLEQCVEVAPVCVVYDGTESPAPGQKPSRVMATESIRVLTPWQNPRGCGQARHAGIVSSKADVVILCDGHMTFAEGWLEKIIAHFADKRHTKHLTCCRMQSLGQDFKPLSDKVMNGAFLAMMTREVEGMHWAIAAKWNGETQPDSGPINAVMGACYAMRREWYDTIGQPLRILEAWGGDEEVLSLATHIMGGKVWLLPIVCGHVYAAQHQGRVDDADAHDRRWSNRLALVDVMPCTDGERAALHDWLGKTRRVYRNIGACFPPERKAAIAEVREVLANGKRKWGDMVRRDIVRPLTDEEQAACLRAPGSRLDQRRAALPPAPPGDKTQIIVRPPEVCKMCGAVNSFRQIAGMRPFASGGVAHARCCRCGHKAQIRAQA